MKFLGVVFFAAAVLALSWARNCPGRKSTSKLFCYYSKLTDVDNCYCTHAILPANSDVKAIERAREHLKGVKILVTVNEFNQGLIDLLKNSKVDGLEIDLKKLDSKNDINEFISTVRSKLGSNLYLALSVPSRAELLAKYYDFKSLSKHADLFILQTAFLGASKNVTFHPSRLSGMWDMQNTDSVVDLVSGLGAPVSKLVISAPVQAFQFTLQNEEYTAPGSPALEVKSLTRNELCDIMNGTGNWTLERDEDQAGPYIFSKNQWIAFEDSTSMDIKAKYSRVRGLAGMALKDISQDGGDKCGTSIIEAAYNGLSRQARAPRAAVLQSLEREIREAGQPLDSIHVSPYRISRVIDVEGKIHAIRQDTRTEFQCTRQGYFVHPRSCNRFYRCVKFDQLVDDFNVFEFDCPAGLAFDERVEVCVWPGSLSQGTPCSGSSEIAPVPRQRFDCPAEQGYYADPENCRWFFACIDHGKSPLTAYEFRCPFGLVFDPERLMCEWSWLVPKCAGGLGLNLNTQYVYGGYSAGQGGGILLEQYNGLGPLGVVKLGGITGKIEQPLVYSNIGTAGLGYNNGGYVNQGGYIVGNGLNGLSYKAAQSLQNAGLLQAGNAGYRQGGVLTGFNGQGNVYYSGEGSGAGASSFGAAGQYQYNSGLAAGNGLNIDGTNLNIAGDYGTRTNAGGYVSGVLQTDGSHGSNLDYNANAFGAKSLGGEGQLQYQAGNVISHGGPGTVQYQANLGSNLDYNSGQNLGAVTTGQYQYNSGLAAGNGLNIDGANLNIAGDYGAKTNAGGYVSGVLQTGASHGSNLDYNANAFGTKSLGGQLQYQTGNVISHGGLGTVQYQANLGSNSNYNSGQNLGVVSTVGLDAAHLQGQSGLLEYNTNANGAGATSSQSFTQYHGQAGQTLEGNVGSGLENNNVNVVVGTAGENYEGNLGLGVGIDNAFGAKLNQGQIVNQVDFNQGVDYNAANAGAKSTQTITQYHGQSLGQGVAGNINIVGGGYSAVGESKSGVEISANGESLDSIVHSTPAPITVTTLSPIPTVTSVPIPALKTASGFESYRGGVVANVPELQYKIQGNANLANISAGFVKFASTPSTVLVNEGYDYQRPVAVVTGNANQNSGVGATSYSYQSLDSSANNGGYVDQGVTLSGYSGSSTVRPAVAVVQQNLPAVAIQKNEGYVYSKPTITFEEGPAKTISSFSISNTPKPFAVVQEHVQSIPVQPVLTAQPVKSVVQPAISTFQRQDFITKGYNYETPTQFVVSSTPQPILQQTPQVYVSSTAAPIVQQKVQVQPAVSSYSFTQDFGSRGYNYPKPSIAFEEQPVVNTYQRVQPAIISKFSIRKPTVQPAVVSTYNVQQPAVVQQNLVQPAVASYSYEQNYKSDGYQYPKPSIAFEETPVVQSQPVQPAVVSTYHYQQPQIQYGAVQPTITYQKPAVTQYTYQNIAQKAVGVYQPSAISTYNYATSTARPVVLEQTVKPAVISSYSYRAPTTSAPAIAVQNVEFGGYDYPKPAVTFSEEPTPIVTSYENKQPVQEVPFVKKKAYITGQANSYQYNQRFESPSAPVVVENYQAPVKAVTPVVTNYQVPVSTPTAPVVVENYQAPAKAYSQAVDTSSTYFSNNLNVVSSTPVYQQEFYSTPVKQVYIQSTPRPTYKSVISSVLTAKVVPTTQAPNFYYYDSRLQSTPKAVVQQGYAYPESNIAVQPIASTTYLPPTREYLPSQTSKPISRFSFSSLDAQFQSVSTPRPFTVSTTPLTREYIPVTSKIQVTTPQPVFVVPEVSTPAYVPVRSKIRYTTSRPVEVTTPAREYLPVSVTSTPIITPTVQYLPGVDVSVRAPLDVSTISRDYLPARQRIRVSTAAPLVDAEYGARRPAKVTIIKQNDLHPLLAAKLGAQCTCVANSLNSRKKQKIIIVEDDDDDDGYVVSNEGGKVIENYQYNSGDTVEITPTPQVYLQSSTGQTLSAPSPTYAIRRRVKIRPVVSEPVTEAVEVFLKNDIASVGPSDREIAGAVRTGLKLVKQAAKEGAEEAISNYGHANIRDTIDCQRAGLFRHPNQCNKFYACRWDCNKNKFTLHTFNCPVQLTFDNTLGACNWPSQGPACLENTLLPSE